MPNPTSKALTSALLRWTIPQEDPASGLLPSADELAALGERGLTPSQEAALIRRIDASAAARDELRALYPARYGELFSDPKPGSAKLLTFPRVGWGLAALAAAAALLLVLRPIGPPQTAQLGVSVMGLERGAANEVAPGHTVHLSMRVPPLPWRAELRGEAQWTRLLLIGPRGRLRSLDADQTSADTLTYAWRAPNQVGEHLFVLVTGFGPTPEVQAASSQTQTLQKLQRQAEGRWALVSQTLYVR